MWLCQFIDWLKFETRPSSLLNFGTAYGYNARQNMHEGAQVVTEEQTLRETGSYIGSEITAKPVG